MSAVVTAPGDPLVIIVGPEGPPVSHRIISMAGEHEDLWVQGPRVLTAM
jgi:hypothetical protein